MILSAAFKTPITYSWNLTLEQQMTSNLLMRLAYVASHSSHQWSPVEINPTLNADAVPVTDPNYNRRVYNKVGCTAATPNLSPKRTWVAMEAITRCKPP